MRYKTVRDVVEHSRKLHHQISDFYQHLSEQHQQERVRMLLDYLKRHEDHLEEVLSRFEKDASQKIWDEWFQYAPEHKLENVLEGHEVRADMDTDEIVTLALKLDDYFIDLYKDMVQNAASSGVRDVFQNLLEMEQKEKIRLARTALEVYDM